MCRLSLTSSQDYLISFSVGVTNHPICYHNLVSSSIEVTHHPVRCHMLPPCQATYKHFHVNIRSNYKTTRSPMIKRLNCLSKTVSRSKYPLKGTTGKGGDKTKLVADDSMLSTEHTSELPTSVKIKLSNYLSITGS